jgi:diaminopimelate decarboxylase
MHHFAYRRGVSEANVLHAEEVDLCDLASSVGTPFYCYSTATLERHYRVFAEAFAARPDTLLCYSIKANSNLGVLSTLAKLGAGMDVVSEGELRRALKVGVPGDRIAFSGVGKTQAEMAHALEAGIYAFNVESEPELHALNEVAEAKGTTARIAFRVNPDVDAGTHHKISTGKAEDKFGVPFEQALSLYQKAVALPGVVPAGVHMHIGSQITELAPFQNAFALLTELVSTLRGAGLTIDFVNLGGGLGIPYRSDAPAPPLPTDYARLVNEALDAAMNDLIRPTLYDAYHQVLPVTEAAPESFTRVTDVVGPVCETGDYLALARPLPELEAGDLIAVMTAGAYGAVQASQYNSRLLVPEVLVSGAEYCVTRPRPDYDDMLKAERLPDWQ